MKLKCLTWNISFGYGPGSDGVKDGKTPPYRQKSSPNYSMALNAMCDLFQQLDVDIVFLQEVDFNSRRSGYVNQLDYISRTSGLNYRLPIVSWNHPYVPYPGLNPKNQFGKVSSGGGVISRYPLRLINNNLLPKPRENSMIYNSFYLARYLQIFKLELPNTELNCTNFHLEAFAQENRELHLVRLQDRLEDYALDLVGGDFNGKVELMKERSEKWDLTLSPIPSFPSQNAVLDGWITKKSRIKIEKVTTLETGTISDHLPVLIEIEITS